MSRMHVAGSVHAEVASPAPVWLTKPTDVNALTQAVWSYNANRDPDGVISIAGHKVTDLAKQFGTPSYFIDKADFFERANTWKSAFAPWSVYYAGKAFLCIKLVRWIAQAGLHLDVCSLGELQVALAAKLDPKKIGMHGSNKSVNELRTGIEAGVGRIIVDSAEEITRIEQLAAELDTKVKVMIRVTAGVEAHTHDYIATAHDDQKFGFSINGGAALVAMIRCYHSERLELLGVHSHIGSQIFDTSGFEVAARRTLKLFAQFYEATGSLMEELDLGGGFGIAYVKEDTPATAQALAANLHEIVEHECRGFGLAAPKMSIEPGRALIGPAGTAIYEVGTVKTVDIGNGMTRNYVSVDGGMSDNIRTALYGAEYSAALANRASAAEPVVSRVVGVHCESGDILVRDEFLPADIQPGDLIAIPAAGAYSRSMASNYNHVPRPGVVAVSAAGTEIMVKPETLEDLLRLDAGVEGES
ncbi:MAG: diaminopimelate decarboxylase [Propionibacteriaceae bacterium]|nr:diaminopimelate decarboxylase [Propionibacteriaceae bacterium]